MNKLVYKQKQLRKKTAKTKLNTITRTSPRISHKKIKNIITNIKKICSEDESQTSDVEESVSSHKLEPTRSDESVIYVGTFNSIPPIIDLTRSSLSLICDEPQTQLASLQPKKVAIHCCNHNKQSVLNKNNNNKTKIVTSKSLVNVPKNTEKYFSKHLSVSISSFFMSKNQVQKLKILDLSPHEIQKIAQEKIDQKKINNCTEINRQDHEIMDMVLDMEQDYSEADEKLSSNRLK